MRSPTVIFLLCVLVFLTLLGCSSKSTSIATSAPTVTIQSPQSTKDGEVAELSLSAAQQSVDARYQSALLDALSCILDKKYTEALTTLKAAQACKDTNEIRSQIARVQGRLIEQSSFEQLTIDIQAIIDQGQGEQAIELVTQALAQYTEQDDATRLMTLQRQAEALLAVKSTDVSTQIARYRSQSEGAWKEKNLRAALLYDELALALRSDPLLQQQVEARRTKLMSYEAALDRADILRRHPATWEAALAANQEALTHWDTPAARQAMADTQLALLQRRERLAVLPFDVHGDVSLATSGLTIPEILQSHLSWKYDLVEQSHTQRITDQLKLHAVDLLVAEQSRKDLSKLLQARYLIVGIISPVSGMTIHARLLDLQTGLVVQTAKLIVPTAEDASRRLPELAAQLLMSDEEKLRYEQAAWVAETPPTANYTGTVSTNLPGYQPGNPPSAFTYSTNKPAAWGGVQVDDYDRIPAKAEGVVTAAPAVFVEQERPLCNRLLSVQIELGDDFYRRGRHREALNRYQLARELEPGNLDILARITQCQQYLRPGASTIPVTILSQPRRERMALLPCLVTSDAKFVSPAVSTWLPDQLAPYLSAAFDIVDAGEVNWMMGRLGLTMSDVVRDASIRRWLGRASGVRYLALGRVQYLNGMVVTLSLLDTEAGWEVGRGQLVAQNIHELKLRLPELVRLALTKPSDRIRLEQEAAAWETEYLQAQEAYRRSQFGLALQLSTSLKKRQPRNLRINFLLDDCQEKLRLAAIEEARKQELERLRITVDLSARRQVELAFLADRARQEAIKRAASLTVEARNQLRLGAQKQLHLQARVAVEGKRWSLALQLLDGAVSLRPGDEALLREAAQARASLEREQSGKRRLQEAQQLEVERRQRELDLAANRQQWTSEGQQYQQIQMAHLLLQQQQDLADYARLLDQAQQLKSQARYDQAAAALQLAKRLNPTVEVDRLLSDVLVEQARAQTRALDAGRLAEWERRLNQEAIRRKATEEQARANWLQYSTALVSAQEAQRNKNYALAIVKYQEAGKHFATDEVSVGIQSAQMALAVERRRLDNEKQVALEEAQRSKEIANLLAAGRTAEQSRKWDAAVSALQQARRLDGTNLEVLVALTRVEHARSEAAAQALMQQQQDQTRRIQQYLVLGQRYTQARQYEAAIAILESALKLSTNDSQIMTQLTETKRLQLRDAEAVVAARKKEETARLQAAERIEKEEQAKKQAEQARQQAEAALAAGDWRRAELALATARKLSPADPRLIKLSQELVLRQSAASRQRTQEDAQTRLEAEALARQSALNQQHQGRVGELLKLAQAALGKKDFTEVEKLINEALTLDSTNLAIGRVQRELNAARQADSRAKSTMSATEKKKQEEEMAKKKVEFGKLMKEGKEALVAEELEKAAKLFAAAKALNPDDADANLFLGMARRDLERTKAAEEVARKEAEAARKQEMEVAKAQADNKKKAEEELRRKLAMDAEVKKRAEALQKMNKQTFDLAVTAGKQALAAKKYDDAVAAFTQASSLMPQDKNVAEQLATAKKLKAEADKLKPDLLFPKKTLTAAESLAQATAMQKQQKWDEALKLYRSVLVQNPNNATAKSGAAVCEFQVHFEAGKAALLKNEKVAALKSLEAALKLVPGHVESQKLLKQARELR